MQSNVWCYPETAKRHPQRHPEVAKQPKDLGFVEQGAADEDIRSTNSVWIMLQPANKIGEHFAIISHQIVPQKLLPT